ncbi:MAG: hypothetical protein M5U34_47105 [Chloroflexi bacterium]|nr:hypothetical protein [Chloroflexota bacterium]
MRNVWIVIENEIRTKLTNRSFWIMTFVFPAFILAINLGTQIFVQNEMAEVDDVLLGAETAVNLPQLGYVDQAGIIISLPPELPADHFQAYADPVAAQAALDTAEIDLYLLVPADFPQSGSGAGRFNIPARWATGKRVYLNIYWPITWLGTQPQPKPS